MAKPENSKTEGKEKRFYAYYLAIIVLSFVFYGNSLKNEYSMDDNLVTSTYESKHPIVEKGIAGIPEIFASHFVVNSKQSYAYRPVTTSSFAIEYQFFGQNPAASHFFNILLYALSIIVLFRLLNQLWGEEKYILTILSCLVFLIHPLHSEVVNNIKSRDEILCLLFGLLALKQTLNFFDKKKTIYVIYSVLLLALSMLSKKNGMIFLAIVPLSLYYFRAVNIKKLGLVIGSVLVGFIVYRVTGKLLLEDTVSRTMYFFENPLYYSGFSERIPMYFYSNYYYLSLLILPYPLRYYYGYDQVPIADWSNPIVYVMLLFMLVVVGISIWRIKKKEVWSYGILFYFLAIGGACNLLFPAVGIIAERFAYVASIGFSILIGYGLYYYFFDAKAKFKNSSKLVKGAIAVMSLVSLFYVFNRNKAWKNDFSIYKTDIENLENSYKAHNLLGQTYYKQSMSLLNSNQPPATYLPKVDSAERAFKTCLSIYQDYAVTYNNLGALNYTFKKNEDSAYYYFEKALEIDSNYTEALYNLGNIEIGRFYGYYYLHQFTTNRVDTLNDKNTVEEVSTYDAQLFAIGKLLQDLNVSLPAIINTAGTKSASQQDFLTHLQNNVLGYLQSRKLLEWLDENDFKSKILTNGQGIIESYENGTLQEHLFNYIATSISTNLLSKSPDVKNLNLQSISNYCETKKGQYKQLFLTHMEKCLALTPSYYAAFQSLNKYYYEIQDFSKVKKLNLQISKEGNYPYKYEFYNNIAKAHYFQSSYDSCKYYLNLTLKEIDLYVKEEPQAQNGNMVSYRNGVMNQLEKVNQILNGTSN